MRVRYKVITDGMLLIMRPNDLGLGGESCQWVHPMSTRVVAGNLQSLLTDKHKMNTINVLLMSLG